MPSAARRALLAGATVAATTAAMLLGVQGAGAAPAPPDTGLLRTVARDATLHFPADQKTGTPAGIQDHEYRQEDPDANNSEDLATANALSPTGVPIVPSTAVDGSTGLRRSFSGLDSFDQRYANNGNQFSIEPPDQGLCVGSGYVVEAVNTVLRIYRNDGTPASPVTDLNSFYGYPAQFDRTTGNEGPFITDPTCLFDAGTNRWFLTVLTIEVNRTTGAFTGANHLDVAVSQTADPTGAFSIYRLPVQDNGNAGTPRHTDCPCIGDYPHIATDRYGFYVTTNEYPISSGPGQFGNNFNGAQIYAFDKQALVNGSLNVNVVQFSHTVLSQPHLRVPGFTLAPAQVPGAQYVSANNGTEYFLSSAAAEEAQPAGFTGQAAVIGVYALTNTKSIRDAQPALVLDGALRPSEQYVQGPRATQKLGPTPLANYCSTVDCGLGNGIRPFAEGPLDSNDTRMMQVYFANGMLYGALDTGVQVNGQLQAGVAWFLVDPGTSPSASSVAHQGYVGVAGQNVTYPAIAALPDGTGAMAVTLSGQDWFPSAAYLFVTPTGVTGPVNVAATGAGPQDGFSEYAPSTGDPDSAPRPRWGDYGAAVPVGSSVWLASEFIDQSCSFAQYQRDMTCGNTRAPLTNWGTRVSTVTP